MYTADRVFVKDLKRLDRNLGCKFKDGRFVITYDRAQGPKAEVFEVVNDAGGFRQPNKCDLDFLCEGDLHQVGVKERMQRTVSYMENYRAKQDKKVTDDLKGCTVDDKIQLSNAINKAYNTSKSNSTFRRIEHKPKGYKVEDKRKELTDEDFMLPGEGYDGPQGVAGDMFVRPPEKKVAIKLKEGKNECT